MTSSTGCFSRTSIRIKRASFGSSFSKASLNELRCSSLKIMSSESSDESKKSESILISYTLLLAYFHVILSKINFDTRYRTLKFTPHLKLLSTHTISNRCLSASMKDLMIKFWLIVTDRIAAWMRLPKWSRKTLPARCLPENSSSSRSLSSFKDESVCIIFPGKICKITK